MYERKLDHENRFCKTRWQLKEDRRPLLKKRSVRDNGNLEYFYNFSDSNPKRLRIEPPKPTQQAVFLEIHDEDIDKGLTAKELISLDIDSQ